MSRPITDAYYAMYKGDTFIDLGKMPYLAQKYDIPLKTVRWLSMPSVHKKYARSKNRLLIYRIED